MATASTGSFSVGDIASLVVAVLALLFAVGSFWWLNARSGRLTLATPRTFAYAGPSGTLRLRFPLSFYNTGAKDLIVEDLRVTSDDFPGPLRWITTRTTIKPQTEDGHEFAKPFAVRGRSTTEVIAEFGDDSWNWRPQPGSEHRVAIEGRLSQSNRLESDYIILLVGSRRESRGLYHPSQRTHRRVIWQPGFALFPRARATHPGR